MKVAILILVLALAGGCQILSKATPLGAATAVADAAAEQTEAAIRENIAGAEVDIAEAKVEAAKIVMDAFKDCWVEYLADRLGVDSHSACTSCAERFEMSKSVCLQVASDEDEASGSGSEGSGEVK